MKTFIFGRPANDPKGTKEEHGEVRIKAPSLAEARTAFLEAHGERDVRTHIVRVDANDIAAPAVRPKRARKPKA